MRSDPGDTLSARPAVVDVAIAALAGIRLQQIVGAAPSCRIRSLGKLEPILLEDRYTRVNNPWIVQNTLMLLEFLKSRLDP